MIWNSLTMTSVYMNLRRRSLTPVTSLFVKKLLPTILIASSFISGVGQTSLIEKYQALVNKALEDSARHFRDGLVALKVNKRSESRAQFDKAVEAFLHSTLNIQKDQKLQSCYSQLVETIYLIEFPSDTKPPQLRTLAASCGWKWNDNDYKLADEIASLLESSRKTSLGASHQLPANKSPETIVGFNSQDFEPSPLDELSKLELTSDEAAVEVRTSHLPSYSRPSIVRAQAGDTVAKLATRHGSDPVEVAKYNGLLPNSTLSAGREIKLPGGNRPQATIAPRPACGTLPKPTVQNVQLGMTVDEISRRLNRKLLLKRSQPQFLPGMSFSFLRNSKGADNIGLVFYQNRLYRIGVEYDSSIRWLNLSEFQNAISRALELPFYWYTTGSETRRFSCESFEIEVSKTERGRYRLVMSDLDAYRRMQATLRSEREKAEAEQRKRKHSFKP